MSVTSAPDFNFSLGLLPRLTCYFLLLLEMSVAMLTIRKPPRHAIMVWPLALVLVYVACLGPLAILLASAHDPRVDALNLLSAAAIIGLALLLTYRPNRAAFVVAACTLGFLVLRYLLAFMSPFHGAYALAVTLLENPYWISILIGEVTQLSAAVAFAWLAIWKPDVFRRT